MPLLPLTFTQAACIWQCSSGTPQIALGLHKREICARQHSLGLLQRIHLTCSGLLADIEVLQKPITVCMQALQEFHGGHHLLHVVSLLLSLLLDQSLSVSLCRLLISDRLGISHTLLRRFPGELLILSLGILLLKFHFLHLFIQISNQHVHHGNHTIAFLALLRVRVPSLWRWRRSTVGELLVSRHLHEANASACNATRSL